MYEKKLPILLLVKEKKIMKKKLEIGIKNSVSPKMVTACRLGLFYLDILSPSVGGTFLGIIATRGRTLLV